MAGAPGDQAIVVVLDIVHPIRPAFAAIGRGGEAGRAVEADLNAT